jgi:hypothetical protein
MKNNMKKFIITEEERNSIRSMYLLEQSTPNFGIAQGSTLEIKNVDIPNVGKGDLTVWSQNPDGGTSILAHKFKVTDVKYIPPMILVNKDKLLYKKADGTQATLGSEAGAAAYIVLNISTGVFEFKLTIRGGISPTVTASNFVEDRTNYNFDLGKESIGDQNRKDAIKKGLGKSQESDSRKTTSDIFAKQDWVKSAQAALPQS